ncbi:ubiquitin-conjugating enzyme E2-binding protein [Corynascus novoguineensis]|uniref:Ubiquitin-conjugating enzyme E2-binding protein n=1 Tax=Corynascus novoguineensis TaxID=1126955 RepID=A0AAN7CSC8_9PEZI|nr:ubiquitin-conjugating enzyme E2-binding protein [Corynascus novoguineensis]
MSSTDCNLYAELLANIRQISLAATLPSPCDASTQVVVSADCKSVVLKHRNSTHTLTLPAKTSLGPTVLPIQEKQSGSKSLEWRLPLDVASLPVSNQADCMPWSATDLGTGSGVACRRCGSDIVRPGSVTVWKDLPSENWAEMMEFWHCHKPDHHHHDHDAKNGKAAEENLATRGYGASSAISAQKGVGFVDLTTLLFDEADCETVTVSFFNFRTSAVTLLKWQISCNSSSGAAPDIPECLAATLISTISRSGSSKSLVMPINDVVHGTDGQSSSENAVHIWVINSSIVYASSAHPQCTPAIKLLYRPLSLQEADKMLEAVTCDSQEINLPAQALNDVMRHLEHSNALLPLKERKFREWNVGLLTRWEHR